MGGGASKKPEAPVAHALSSGAASANSSEDVAAAVDSPEPSSPHAFAVASREIGNDGFKVTVGRRPSIQYTNLSGRRHSVSFEYKDTIPSTKPPVEFTFFGVVDSLGKKCSDTSSLLVSLVQAHLKDLQNSEEFKHGDTTTAAYEAMKQAMSQVQKHFEDEGSTAEGKTHNSGSCATIVFHSTHSKDLICASVGDCRAVWIDFKESSLYEITPDHSWSNPEEAQRALDLNCIVKTQMVENVGDVGRKAVWYGPEHKKFIEGKQAPGLGMSRIFGYTSARDAGVSNEGEVRIIKNTLDGEKSPSSNGQRRHSGVLPHKVLHTKPLNPGAPCLNLENGVLVLGSQGFWQVTSTEDILRAFVAPPKIDFDNKPKSIVDLQLVADSMLSNATQRWEEMWTDHAIEIHLFSPSTFQRLAELKKATSA